MLTLELPEEFKTELRRIIREIYYDAQEQARTDIGLMRDYYTIPEVCVYMNVARNTLEDWIKKGLSVYRIGNKKYIRKKDIHEFMDYHKL